MSSTSAGGARKSTLFHIAVAFFSHRHRGQGKGLWIIAFAFAAHLASLPAALAVAPADDNDVTPGEIRANYHKRYPYAAHAAQLDTVEKGVSAAGEEQKWKAYTSVKQPCIGGYLDTLNALTDQLGKLNRQLRSQLGRDDAELANQLDQQMDQINKMSKDDLATKSKELKSMTQVQGDAGNPQSLMMQALQSQINGLNSMLSQFDLGSISTDTDGKACCFKNYYDKVKPPPYFIHYFYIQEEKEAKVTPPTKRDQEAFTKGLIKTYGLPMSDTQFQIIDRNNRQRLLEHLFDPERWMWMQMSSGHMQTASVANSMGGAAEAGFKSAVAAIDSTLINVANEDAAQYVKNAGEGGARSLGQAVYIVQQMYKYIFVPMHLFLFLPGAILTQVKCVVSHSFLGGGEDSTSPFEGILRATIAIFLIPSTQLIVSYAIDTGNALTGAVIDPTKNWVQEQKLINWAKEQTYIPREAKFKNGVYPGGGSPTNEGGDDDQTADGNQADNTGAGNVKGTASGGGQKSGGVSQSGFPTAAGDSGFAAGLAQAAGVSADNPAVQAVDYILSLIFGEKKNKPLPGSENAGAGQGKAAGQLEGTVVQEDQLWLSGTMQAGFNGLAFLMGSALTVLTAYQVVFMCYLFLLGPIAACFFAWPSGMGKLFRAVFSNWLDAVVVLSLWRFWWCVILAVMTQRVVYLHPNPGAPAEMMMFNCFLALLLFVPFQPFNFNPGQVAASILDKAGQGGGGGGRAGGGGGGDAGAHHGESAGAPPSSASHQHNNRAMRELAHLSSNWHGSAIGSPESGHQAGAGAGSPGERAHGSGSRRAVPSAKHQAVPPPTSNAARPSAGHGAAGFLPPSSGKHVAVPANAALHALQGVYGVGAIGAVTPGQPPVPPLVPPAGAGSRFILNTSQLALANAGIRTWQQSAGALSSVAATGGAAPFLQAPPASPSVAQASAGQSTLSAASSQGLAQDAAFPSTDLSPGSNAPAAFDGEPAQAGLESDRPDSSLPPAAEAASLAESETPDIAPPPNSQDKGEEQS